jgi:hypothetical protein
MMTAEKETSNHKKLSAYEQETIINFNKEEDLAHIFTYQRTWQKHLELKLGLKPILDNGFGGKGYRIDKHLIPVPRAKRQYSPAEKKRKAVRLANIRRRKRLLL